MARAEAAAAADGDSIAIIAAEHLASVSSDRAVRSALVAGPSGSDAPSAEDPVVHIVVRASSHPTRVARWSTVEHGAHFLILYYPTRVATGSADVMMLPSLLMLI